MGVFPLAIDGLPAVVEDKPLGISADPALGIPLPGIELGVPGIASRWLRRLGCGGVGSASWSRAGFTRSSMEMLRAAALAASRWKVPSGTVRWWGIGFSIEGAVHGSKSWNKATARSVAACTSASTSCSNSASS